MISGLIVANKIIELCNNKQIEINHLKLQKLLYFVQDAYFEKYKNVLFNDKFFAWKLGPVVPVLYRAFMDYSDKPIPSDNLYRVDTTGLNKNALDVIEEIVDKYGFFHPYELVKKTQKPGDRWDVAKNTKGLGCIISFI